MKNSPKKLIIALSITCSAILILVLSITIFIPLIRYNMGMNAYERQNYSEAIEMFDKSNNFNQCLTSDAYYSSIYHHAINHETESILLSYQFYRKLPENYLDTATRMQEIEPYVKWCRKYGNGERAEFATGYSCSLADVVEIRVFRDGDLFKWGIYCVSDTFKESGAQIINTFGIATENGLETILFDAKDTDTTKNAHYKYHVENDGEHLISEGTWDSKTKKDTSFIDFYTYTRID